LLSVVVRARVAPRAPAPFFDAVLGDLLAAGIVTGRDKLRLSSHAPAESPERARLAEAVESRFREGGLTPPDLATVAADLRASTAEVDRAIRGLIQAGRVSRLGELVFHADALTTLAAAIQAMRTVSPASPATVDVATFKQRFGLTRKHAIPLLEWLDRQRLTRRVGQSRTVL
jgi:selenocysteine-specific elongation factor